MPNRHRRAIRVEVANGLAGLLRYEVHHNMVPKKVDVEPTRPRTAFRAAKHADIEGSSPLERINGNRQVKLSRNAYLQDSE